MKIVISPAKSLDFETRIPISEFSQPFFTEEMTEINSVMKELTPKELADLMNISDKLAELNWQRNQAFSLPFLTENARQAIYTFNGDVYEGLDIHSLDTQEVNRLQKSLRILSGLYGVLKPLDLIQPYRLEMGTKLKIGKKRNLYDFWKEKITHYLNEELTENELFINLASNEYFDSVEVKNLKTNVITPVFKDWKGDSLKVISFYAKKARGLMVRYIIKNNIQTFEELKGFDYQGYTFSETLSKNNELVFVR